MSKTFNTLFPFLVAAGLFAVVAEATILTPSQQTTSAQTASQQTTSTSKGPCRDLACHEARGREWFNNDPVASRPDGLLVSYATEIIYLKYCGPIGPQSQAFHKALHEKVGLRLEELRHTSTFKEVLGDLRDEGKELWCSTTHLSD